LLADNGYFSEGNEPVIAMGREAHHPLLADRRMVILVNAVIGTKALRPRQ
jgi:hypothetical protein